MGGGVLEVTHLRLLSKPFNKQIHTYHISLIPSSLGAISVVEKQNTRNVWPLSMPHDRIHLVAMSTAKASAQVAQIRYIHIRFIH